MTCEVIQWAELEVIAWTRINTTKKGRTFFRSHDFLNDFRKLRIQIYNILHNWHYLTYSLHVFTKREFRNPVQSPNGTTAFVLVLISKYLKVRKLLDIVKLYTLNRIILIQTLKTKLLSTSVKWKQTVSTTSIVFSKSSITDKSKKRSCKLPELILCLICFSVGLISNPSSTKASVKYQFLPQAETSPKASCRNEFIFAVWKFKVELNFNNYLSMILSTYRQLSTV